MRLETKNIDVNINKTEIVKNISLAVEKGEFVGILGPNGSGKSTFLKSIYRVLKPNSGYIYLNGKELSTIPIQESAKEMSIVSQFNSFQFDFSVKEVVMMGRSPHKKKFEMDNAKDYEIVIECLKKVSMEGYINRRFATLSGGEKQRIILARALAQQPKFLILDEPTNHLDIKYQLELLEVVKGLDIEVIAALHDLNLAAMYCDKIYIMKNGNIVSYGKPEEVITKEMLRDVFEVDGDVYIHPKTNKINIIYFGVNY